MLGVQHGCVRDGSRGVGVFFVFVLFGFIFFALLQLFVCFLFKGLSFLFICFILFVEILIMPFNHYP